eukprot:3060246-Pleurochrysis_carterae.AAC.2
MYKHLHRARSQQNCNESLRHEIFKPSKCEEVKFSPTAIAYGNFAITQYSRSCAGLPCSLCTIHTSDCHSPSHGPTLSFSLHASMKATNQTALSASIPFSRQTQRCPPSSAMARTLGMTSSRNGRCASTAVRAVLVAGAVASL